MDSERIQGKSKSTEISDILSSSRINPETLHLKAPLNFFFYMYYTSNAKEKKGKNNGEIMLLYS